MVKEWPVDWLPEKFNFTGKPLSVADIGNDIVSFSLALLTVSLIFPVAAATASTGISTCAELSAGISI